MANPYDSGLFSDSTSNPYSSGLFDPIKPKKKKDKKKDPKTVALLVEAAERGDLDAFHYIATEMGLTSRQRTLTLEAVKRNKEQDRSFGDSLKGIGKGALGGASWALDKLMRPSWAVSAAVSEALGGESDIKEASNPLEAAWRGLSGKTRKGFGEILDEQGVLEGHGTLRGVAGFGLDVATDPLMLASIAGASVTGGGSVAAYAAAKSAGKGISMKVVSKAAREAGERAIKGETDDVLEEILASAGKSYQNRLGLLRHNKELGVKAKNVMQMTKEQLDADMRQLHIAESMAKAEARIYDPRVLSVGLGTQKHGVRLTTPIPIITRPGAKLAQKGVPILSQLSDAAGRAFVPGFKNEIFRAGELARQHAGEFNAVIQRDAAVRIFEGVDKTLSSDEMLDALHLMQQPLKRGKTKWNAVVPSAKEGGFDLNTKYLDELESKGMLSAIQRDFVERYHKTTSYLAHLDSGAGLTYKNYEATGRMYVPHTIRDGVDTQNVVTTSLLTRAGFEHGKDVTLSLKQIRDLAAEGKMDDIFEYNPMMALAKRSRAGAERQADMALINTLRGSIGVPARLVDKKKVGRVEARIGAATTKYEGSMRAAAAAEDAYTKKIQAINDELEQVYEAGKKAFDKRVVSVRKTNKAKAVTKLEKQIEKLKKKPAALTYGVRKKSDGKGYEFFSTAPGSKKITVEGERKLQREAKAAAEELERTRAKVKWTPDESKIKQLEGELKKLKHGKYTDDEVDALEAGFGNVDAAYDKAVKAANNPRSKFHKDATKEELLSLKTAKEVLADAKREMRAANAALSAAKRGKKNPAVTRDMVKIGTVLDEFDNEYMFPKEAKATILRLRRLISGDDKTVDDFARGFGRMMGAWKILVTTVNPGYRLRNSATDFWNMWVAGVPAVKIPKYTTQATRILHAMKDPTHGNYVEAFRVVQEASNHGILSGLFAGDIQTVAQMLKHSGSTKKQLLKEGRYIAATTRLAQDFNREAENIGRLTHYLYRRRSLGESAADAAFRVKIAHFDYEDLTDFEQRVMKKVFPFYTWTRKNIPYQVRQIVAQPGRYSAFPKLAQEAQYAASGTEGSGPVPEFVSEGFGFQVPFGEDTFFMPQFGVSDLEVFQGPDEAFQRVKQQLNPFAKVPAEMALNRSFFTGAPIDSELHPRAPVSSIGAGLLSLFPGSDVGETARTGPGGERITGPGADPYYAYLLGQIPWLRSLGVNATGIKAQQTDRAGLISQLSGLSTVNVDPALQTYYTKLETEDVVDKMIQGLRDEGRIPVKKRKTSDFDKIINSILKGKYG